jgi:hypothetical protein
MENSTRIVFRQRMAVFVFSTEIPNRSFIIYRIGNFVESTSFEILDFTNN